MTVYKKKQLPQRRKKRYSIVAILAGMSLLTACGTQKKEPIMPVDFASDFADKQGLPDQFPETTLDEWKMTSIVQNLGIFADEDLDTSYDEANSIVVQMNQNWIECDSPNVTSVSNIVTISEGGTYILQGSLKEGQIVVDSKSEEAVHLVLNGIVIHKNKGACIYIKNAEKVYITLATGTENELISETIDKSDSKNEIDAAIYSKDDLTINGSGSLSIQSYKGNGIISKDQLIIADGTYTIQAVKHGMVGKDSVAVLDGDFDLKVGKDAIRSTVDDEEDKGYVYIEDGTFQIEAGSDAVSAVNEIYIAGGKLQATKCEEGLEARLINILGGEIAICSNDDGMNATDKRKADKNDDKEDTEPDARICIAGGVTRINTEGDGVDSNGYLLVTGGELYVTGPSDDKNGPLDYGIDAAITGGIVVAAGQNGMAQNFGQSGSTQCSILVSGEQHEAGSVISLSDSNSTELLSFVMDKKYNCVVISTPDIKLDGDYTVKMDDEEIDVTLTESIYGTGYSMGGPGKMGDRKRPKAMEDMEPPENKEGMEPPADMGDMDNWNHPEDMEE